MRKVLMALGGASVLLLAGCSTMEEAGVAPREAPAVTTTSKADQPRKTAMTAVGIAPVQTDSAVAYMQQQASDMHRQLSDGGVAVVRHGTTVVLILPGDMTFAKASADIDSKFFPVLDNIAAALNQYPATYVDIVGYADSSGTKALNQTLSEKRANATAGYLVDHRVKSERIYVAGKGEANPIASNDTAEGRARNRRVEITLRPMIDH